MSNRKSLITLYAREMQAEHSACPLTNTRARFHNALSYGMTLSIAWVRNIGHGAEELVFASDSRLSGGNRFDEACKILEMPGSSSAVAFAGLTYWAYPMMLAAVRAAAAHRPARTGAMRIKVLKPHLLNALSEMQKAVHSYSNGENIPDVVFLFGGYDWHSRAFLLWRVHFDEREGRFRSDPCSSRGFGRMGSIGFAGDKTWVSRARRLLRAKAQEKYGPAMDGDGAGFDLEPFQVLCDLLSESTPEDTIGGAPQLVKVYQHRNCSAQGVYWPTRENGHPFLCGRRLLPYENVDAYFLDPVSLRSYPFSRDPVQHEGDDEAPTHQEQKAGTSGQ